MLQRRIIALISGLAACLLLVTACSTTKVKTLTKVELAQQLIADQKTNQFDNTTIPITMHYTVPEKVVLGKELDIYVELSSSVALPELTIAYEAGDGIKFKKRWLVLKQESVTRKIKNIEADKLYHQKITVIPRAEGLLSLNVYTIYPEANDQRAKKLAITLATGDAVKRERDKVRREFR